MEHPNTIMTSSSYFEHTTLSLLIFAHTLIIYLYPYIKTFDELIE